MDRPIVLLVQSAPLATNPDDAAARELMAEALSSVGCDAEAAEHARQYLVHDSVLGDPRFQTVLSQLGL